MLAWNRVKRGDEERLMDFRNIEKEAEDGHAGYGGVGHYSFSLENVEKQCL